MNNKSTSPGTTPPRSALGKGLASLLPNATNASKAHSILSEIPSVAPQTSSDSSTANKERIPGITMADIDQIIANQYQPRRDFDPGPLEDLAASIRANGIIQPLIVRRGEDGALHLIAGERRLRASKIAGLKQVPVVIRKTTDKESLELALIENIQREDLNCVDIALSYFQLIEDFSLTQDEVAGRVGKDRVSVANHLRILKLPETIINDLRQNKLSYGHGRALLSVTDPIKRMELRNAIVEKHLSVRETERLAAAALVGTDAEKKKRKNAEETPEAQELKVFSDKLARALGSKVAIQGDKFRGKIQIEYFCKEDLERLSEQLLR